MESETRKQKFVELLEEILNSQCKGVKAKLAQKLELKPTRLTAWFQGKIDPASIEILPFSRLAEFKGYSVDELAKEFQIGVEKPDPQVDKFRKIIEELLHSQSQEQLGKNIGVSQNAISRWINPDLSIDPAKIPTERMVAIAKAKGWTVERLLIYLGLKKPQTENNLFFKLKSSATLLSFKEQVRLLTWLSNLVDKQLTENRATDNIAQLEKKELVSKSYKSTVLIILDKEDTAIADPDLSLAQRATNYSSNLVHYLQLQPGNIQVASIENRPESLEDFDLLIFDISSSESEAISLIQDISFDSDIVVFAFSDLAENVRSSLEDKVTEVVLKPIDWSSLRDKTYFR